jgi:hypothetical protein
LVASKCGGKVFGPHVIEEQQFEGEAQKSVNHADDEVPIQLASKLQETEAVLVEHTKPGPWSLDWLSQREGVYIQLYSWCC